MLRSSRFDTHIRGNVLGNSPNTSQRYDIIQQNIDYVFHHCQFILTQIRQKPSYSFRVMYLCPKYVSDITHNYLNCWYRVYMCQVVTKEDSNDCSLSFRSSESTTRFMAVRCWHLDLLLYDIFIDKTIFLIECGLKSK